VIFGKAVQIKITLSPKNQVLKGSGSLKSAEKKTLKIKNGSYLSGNRHFETSKFFHYPFFRASIRLSSAAAGRE